jgi:hypothetical protein
VRCAKRFSVFLFRPRGSVMDSCLPNATFTSGERASRASRLVEREVKRFAAAERSRGARE